MCEVATDVGDTYRYEWAQVDGEERFGFTGEVLESSPPHRAVTTEQMIGMDGPGTTNEMTLTPVEGGTLLSILITYPSAEVRDMVLGTGMTDGMETSYARLERDVLSADVITGRSPLWSAGGSPSAARTAQGRSPTGPGCRRRHVGCAPGHRRVSSGPARRP